jgi:hypothetical protein
MKHVSYYGESDEEVAVIKMNGKRKYFPTKMWLTAMAGGMLLCYWYVCSYNCE